MHCLLHGVSPEDVSFEVHARIVASYYSSVHRIKGGGKSLAEALDARCTASGVDVLTGRTVKEVVLSSPEKPPGRDSKTERKSAPPAAFPRSIPDIS